MLSKFKFYNFILILACCIFSFCFAKGQDVNNHYSELLKIDYNNMTKEQMFKVYKMSLKLNDQEKKQMFLKIVASGLLSIGESKIYNAKIRREIIDIQDFENLFLVQCPHCNQTDESKSPCGTCRSSGKCFRCRGSGIERFPKVGGGYMTARCYKCNGVENCPDCNGQGYFERTCSKCSGKGRIVTKEQVKSVYEMLVLEALTEGMDFDSTQDCKDNALQEKKSNDKSTERELDNPITESKNIPQEITVKVSGYGVNESQALEDAFLQAIRKVEGVYVVSNSSLTNNQLDESIYLNCDAVVKHHKVINKKTQGDVVVLEVEATIVKNNFLKYVSNKKSSEISSRDIGNLLVHRQALMGAEKSLVYILKDYSEKILKAIKKGDLYLGENDDVENNNLSLGVDYEIRFDDNEYKILQRKLINLLSKFAIDTIRGDTKEYKKFFGGNYEDKSILAQIYSSDSVKKWPKGTKTILFIDEITVGGSKHYNYRCYAIPKQIFDKISELISQDAVIEFNFECTGREKPIQKYLSIDFNFFDYYYCVYSRGEPNGICSTDDEVSSYTSTIVFKNWFKIRTYKRDYWPDDWKEGKSVEYSKDWILEEEEVRSMESCDLKVYSGMKAKCLYAIFTKDIKTLYDLSEKGYIPAMIAMAELKDGYDSIMYWYNKAALMGSAYAQQKAGWKNSGLGFEILDNLVVSSRGNSEAKRGMIIKKINDEEINNWRTSGNIAKIIATLNPGETVKIEFKNGKVIEFAAQ